MDFQSKKFWTFIVVSVLRIIAGIWSTTELVEAVNWITATAAGWGLLDTAAKFVKPKGDK